MSLTLDGTSSAQIASPAAGAHWLIEMDFLTATFRVTTAPIDVLSGGFTYIGLGQQITVDDVSENADVSAAILNVTLSLTNDVQLAAAIGQIDHYRNRPIRLYVQFFNQDFKPIGTKVLRWSGKMNPVKVKPKRSGNGTLSGRIELPCTRSGMNVFRNYQGIRLTHQQHIQRYPGDLGLEYMSALLEKPALWLSKRFQEI